MFDLFRSRTKTVRYVLGALLALVALSMVVTLIPGFGVGMGVSSRDVLAEVGDQKITAAQFHKLISAQMREGRLTRETMAYYIPQLLNQTLGELATMYQANQMGLTATNQEVVENIRMMVPQLFQDGKFIGGEPYRQFLASNGMTISEFEANVRKQIVLRKLQALAFEGTIVTQGEVEAEYKKRKALIRFDIVRFVADDFKSQAAPGDAEVRDYYEKNKAQYMSPVRRAFELVVVDELKLGESIAIPDSSLRQLYASQLDRWRQDERVHVRHILLKTNDQPKDKHPEIRKKMEDILKQVKGGADFGELAKKHSQDPGSANRGGDLDWVTKGQMVPNFEKTSFSLQPKQISDIVETEFGYHIIQVLAKEAGRVKPFEEVKQELAAEAKRSQLFERMPALADQARAELVQAPTQAEAIAKKLNLGYIKVAAAGPGDPIPNIGVSPQFDQALYALQKNEVSEVVQVQGNKLVVGALNEILPQTPEPLSKVETQIKNMLATGKSTQLAGKKAAEFEARFQANHGDLLRTAKEMNAKVHDSKLVDRSGNIEGVGMPMMFGEIVFTLPVGAVHGPHRVGDRTFYLKVTERKEADMTLFAAERESILNEIRGSKIAERRELFEAGLVEALKNQGKLKVNETVLTRVLNSMTS
jgi:peptidyl-prolyl cis-trans isomerase D